MSWTGTLAEVSFGTVLKTLVDRKAVGRLRVQSQKVTLSLRIANGHFIGMAIVGADESRLGQLLLTADQIDERQLKDALKLQKKSKMPLGKILAGQGVILKDTLTRYIHLQCIEMILRCLSWTEGRFDFMPVSEQDSIPTIDPLRIVGVLKEWQLSAKHMPTIQRYIPDMEQIFEKRGRLEDYFKSQEKTRATLTEIDLDAKEKTVIGKNERLIFTYVNGKSSVHKISRLAGMTHFRTCIALANLMSTKLVGAVRSEAAGGSQRRTSVPNMQAAKRGGFARSITEVAMTQAGDGASRVAGQVIFFALVAVMAMAVFLNLVLREQTLFRPHKPKSPGVTTLLQRHQEQRVQRALSIHFLESMSYPQSLNQLVQSMQLYEDDLTPDLWPTTRQYWRGKDPKSYSLK